MRNETISIQEKEDNTFVANFDDSVLCSFQGIGATIEEAIKDMFLKINTASTDDEEERMRIYINNKRPEAFEFAKELFKLMGVEYFELYQYVNKSNQPKENAKLMLNFLSTFGYVQADRKKGAGKRFRVVLDTSDMIRFYESEASKYESTFKYYNALKQQLVDFEQAEKKDEKVEDKVEENKK